MTVLAIIGLVLGLVVLLVVIKLLNDTLKPLLSILADVQNAKTAPMLERGVPGTEQLGQTRQLAESVPPLALAYLEKLGASPAPPPPAYAPPPPAWSPPPPPPGGCERGPAAAGRSGLAGLEEVQRTMSTVTMVSALSENQNAWVTTLVVGVVILLVVIALLEMLRRTVVKLNDDLWRTWVSGKAVVKNTATSYQLKNTRQAGDELVEELRTMGSERNER